MWKSTSASGASWLGRVARNRHRHAIEQALRRWRGTRRKILISTQVKPIGKRQVMLSELVEEVKRTRPPPIRTSTKVFLRCYPEVFWVTTHIASGLSEVRLNKTLEPPTFL